MERLKNLQNQIQESVKQNDNSKLMNPKCNFDFKSVGTLKDKVIVCTGGSRGIGLAIVKRAAQDGAKVAILAKTAKEHPKLPGTIYTAAKEIEEVGGQALPLQCDIRDEENVKACIAKVVEKWGRIDILINNASAINLIGTLELDMKRYDLMHHINTRGTFMVSKYCIPHMLKSANPHILNLSPPLNMEAKWFAPFVGYTMAKFGMSMCVLGMHEEFRSEGLAVNALWPKTSVATAAVQNVLGGDEMIRKSRKDSIMADAAYIILTSNSRQTTGNFYVDEDILRKTGVSDFSKYKIDPNTKEEDIILDFFL